MRRALFLALLLIGLISPRGFAADKTADDIRVKAEIDRAFLTVGDRLTYTVTVEHSPDIQVLSSIPPPASDILEIKKNRGHFAEGKEKDHLGKKIHAHHVPAGGIHPGPRHDPIP